MKKRLGKFIIEIIPVMIGVFLGVAVSNWSASRQQKNLAKTYVQSLLAEVDMNSSRLRNVHDYHVMLRDSCRIYGHQDASIKPTNFFKGTRIMKLANSAFHTGIQTGIINELPIETIQSLNAVYTFQDDFNEFGNMIMSELITKDRVNDEERRKIARFLALTMTDVVIQEKELIEQYDFIKSQLAKHQ